MVANSKVDSVEVKSSRLRKDLIEATDQSTKAQEKVKQLKEALKSSSFRKTRKSKLLS